MANENVLSDLDQLDDQIQKQIAAKMTATGQDYMKAMAAVQLENPDLFRLREAAYRRRESATTGATVWRLINGKLVEIDHQVEELTRKVQAAHPEVGYGEALRMVASEHHDLFCLREQFRRVLLG